MDSPKRGRATPSTVSDGVTLLLHREVIRLEKLQEKRGLKPAELHQLLAIAEAMRDLEGARMDAVVSILGHRFKHRDVPDDVLKPMLAAITGEDEGG